MQTRNRNALYVFGCYVLWGILPVFWKLLGSVNSVYVLAARIVWSFVFCLLVLLMMRDFPKAAQVLKDRKELLRLFLCGVMITVNWGSYIYAVSSGHILDASLAYYLNPIISVFIGFLVFRERLSGWQWFSVGIATIGILVPVIHYGTIPWMALVIGGSFAMYSMIKKKVKAESQISLFLETAFMTPFALFFLCMMEVQGRGAYGVLDGAQWLLFPISGVVTTIPLFLFARGISRIPMSLAGILMYINPTLQFLVGVMLYGEKLKLTDGIMFVCVWLALIIFLMEGKKKKV